MLQEPEEAPEPGLARFHLFPTVEEQVEAIAEAQAEEKRQTEIDASTIHRVPDAVVDRILTSGGNSRHSIERIVAFFQKSPSSEDAAAFLEKEYGVGGKGLTVAQTKYAMMDVAAVEAELRRLREVSEKIGMAVAGEYDGDE